MRWLVKILACLFVVFILILFLKDPILKLTAEKMVTTLTGLPLKVDALHFGLIKSRIDIKNLRLYNPRNFPETLMLTMPEIYIVYDLSALLRGILHFKDMRIHLKEIIVLKNKEGQVNLEALKQDSKGKMPEFRIDNLELTIKQAIYKDYSASQNPPMVKEFNINLHEHYTNITNPYTLVGLIAFQVLSKTAIARLVNMDTNQFKDMASEVLPTTVKDILQRATEKLNTIFR